MALNLNNTRIRTKLILSFSALIVIFFAVLMVMVINLNTLAALQDAGAKRSEDSERVREIQTHLGEMYAVFADAVINQNLLESNQEFKKVKKIAYDDAIALDKLADTGEEEIWAKEYRGHLEKYIGLFDPLIKAINRSGGKLSLEIRNIDGKIDGIRDQAIDVLGKIGKSLEKEARDADKKFDTTISETLVVLSILFGVSILMALLLTLLIVRSINNGINNILTQMKNLINNILNGNLDEKGDPESTGVDFRDIIVQTNDLLDAFLDPLNITSEYIERISKGDIPDEIVKEYKGDFNIIKDNLNTLIRSTNEITNAMIEVSKGNFGVEVKVRSASDELMPAINNVILVLTKMNEEFLKLADAADNGDLSFRGEETRFDGAYRDIVKIVNQMLDYISEPWNVISDYVTRISGGELPKNIAASYKGDFETMKLNINQMIANLTDFTSKVQGASSMVASGSEQMSSSTQEMAQSASEQAASIEEVSSSMEEMNSSVAQNADNARETASIAGKASKDAIEGGSAVKETVEAMRSIAEKINIIEEIARQTNMLALNAAIEAARAGEHGKGFAVVADEVRNLAGRSGTAAREISDLSGSSVEIAEKAGTVIETVVVQIQKTSDLVQEINASSSEQANGVEQVTQSITLLDKAIQQNSAATEQMASTSEELSTQAFELQKVSSFFQIEGGFKKTDSFGQSGGTTKNERVVKSKTGKMKEDSDGGITIDMGNDDEFERF